MAVRIAKKGSLPNTTKPGINGRIQRRVNRHREIITALLPSENLNALYQLSPEHICKTGGREVLSAYNWSVYHLAKTLFPHHHWQPWKFSSPPGLSWWRSLGAQLSRRDPDALRLAKEYIEDLQNRLGLSSHRDWEIPPNRQKLDPIDQRRIAQMGGFVNILSHVYSPESVRIWKFQKTPSGWWSDLAAKFYAGDQSATALTKLFIADIAEQWQVRSLDDWYSVVHKIGKGRIYFQLSHFGSLERVLKCLHPNHPWKFQQDEHILPRVQYEEGQWSLARYRRQFLDSLKEERGYSFESFYEVTYSSMLLAGGSGLLATYANSAANSIQTEYPEHAWEPWRFVSTRSKLFWDEVAWKAKAHDPLAECVLRNYTLHLEAVLGVQSPSDWYNAASKVGDLRVIQAFGGLMNVLNVVYPHHVWDLNKLTGVHKPHLQHSLKNLVEHLVPIS